jgi:hypothetical protein
MLGALAALSLLPANVAAVGGPSIPGLPGVPHIHLPKPDQKAVFDVIVEGKAKDDNHSQLSGQEGECTVTEDGHVVETATYLRGRGVKVEFDRYGHTIVVKRNRGGQLGDTSLAVKVTLLRTAEGSVTYAPAVPGAQCPKATDISKNPDCGKPKTPGGAQAVVLGWKNDRITLDVSPNTKRGGLVTDDKCGEDAQTGISDQLFWAWSNPAELSAVEGLPARKIFNRHIHAIAIKLLSPRGDRLKPYTRTETFAKLKGTVSDTDDNSATVRLIRQSG